MKINWGVGIPLPLSCLGARRSHCVCATWKQVASSPFAFLDVIAGLVGQLSRLMYMKAEWTLFLSRLLQERHLKPGPCLAHEEIWNGFCDSYSYPWSHKRGHLSIVRRPYRRSILQSDLHLDYSSRSGDECCGLTQRAGRMDPWGRAAGNLAVRLEVTGRAAEADSRFALLPFNRRGGTSFNVTFNVRIP